MSHYQNTPDTSQSDHSFSSFLLGILLGAATAYFLTTEEGKRFIKKVSTTVSDLTSSPTSPTPAKEIPEYSHLADNYTSPPTF